MQNSTVDQQTMNNRDGNDIAALCGRWARPHTHSLSKMAKTDHINLYCMLMAAQVHESWHLFLRLADAIAKHNARIRARYPATDTFYKKVEKLFFGTFNDMPFPLVVFAGVVEDAAHCLSADGPHEFSRQIANALDSARFWAGRPPRSQSGSIVWKKSMSHIETTLLQEIESCAKAFITSVHALRGYDDKTLAAHEEQFWKRFRNLQLAEEKARKDLEPAYEVLLCLRHSLPNAISAEIVRYII